MKVIGLGLQKGGVGKTSLAIALATELAKTSKVLLIDTDPQGNSSGALLEEIGFELADALLDKCRVDEPVTETKIKNLWIMPTKALSDNEKEVGPLRTYKQNVAAGEPYTFDDIAKEFADQFDYIIYDTSPDFSYFEQNVFFSCDEIIPVIKCDAFSMDGITIFLNNIAKFKKAKRCTKADIKTIAINEYNASYSLCKNVQEEITKAFPNCKIIVIPQDQAFKKAQMIQKTVQEVSEKSSTKEALEALANSVRG